MILLRRTHLEPKEEIKIKVPGIIDIVVGRTEEGIVYDNVEVLTKNVKLINMLASQSSLPFQENNSDSHLFTKNTIGYLVHSETELIQLNQDKEPVASIPLGLFTALQFMSARKHFISEDVGTHQPIMEVSDYALTQIGISPRQTPMVFEKDGYLYTKIFGKVAKHSKTFKEDRESIIKIYSTIKDPSEVIETINTYKVYSLFSESRFVVWNDMVCKLNNFGVELKAPFYI